MAEFNEKNLHENAEEQELFDMKKIWSLLLLNWYWVLISVVLCLGVSVIYLRYKSPVYAASMKVLVKDSNQKNKAFSGMGLALGEMGLMSNSDGFDNELEILRSTSLSSSVAKRLKLYVRYYLEGTVKNQELYKNTPIFVDLEEECLDTLSTILRVEICQKEKSYQVYGYFDQLDPDKVTFSQEVASLPALLDTPFGAVTIGVNTEFYSKQLESEAEKVTEAMKDGRSLYVAI